MMNRIKTPSNKKKRLYKMAKHLGNPQERWWLTDSTSLSYEQWVEQFGKPMGTTESGFTEEGIRQWVDGLYGSGQQAARKHWLSMYQQIYVPVVNTAIQSAISGGFGFKGISSVHVGSRNFPVWMDCYVSPTGLVVFLETKKSTPVNAGFPKELRSAFRPAPSVDIPAWGIAQYYQTRSQQYAERFNWSIPEGTGGWSLGDTSPILDADALRAALSSVDEVVGGGLMRFVLNI
jgi:hypothetical protein